MGARAPVRFRKTVRLRGARLSICEGKNRQVRRMTAKVGLPTLRLVQNAAIGVFLLMIYSLGSGVK